MSDVVEQLRQLVDAIDAHASGQPIDECPTLASIAEQLDGLATELERELSDLDELRAERRP